MPQGEFKQAHCYSPEVQLEALRTIARIALEVKRVIPDPDMRFIRVAIAIGELEGRRVSISGIAASTGIPRATVKRKVAQLVASGICSLSSEGTRKVVRHLAGDDPAWVGLVCSNCVGFLQFCNRIAELP